MMHNPYTVQLTEWQPWCGTQVGEQERVGQLTPDGQPVGTAVRQPLRVDAGDGEEARGVVRLNWRPAERQDYGEGWWMIFFATAAIAFGGRETGIQGRAPIYLLRRSDRVRC